MNRVSVGCGQSGKGPGSRPWADHRWTKEEEVSERGPDPAGAEPESRKTPKLRRRAGVSTGEGKIEPEGAGPCYGTDHPEEPASAEWSQIGGRGS